MSAIAKLRGLPRDRPWIALVLAVLAVELVGASGSIFTLQGLESWYGTLTRPAVAPPNWVFGPVWTTLFAMLGGAVWLVWRDGADGYWRDGDASLALWIFAGHMVLNVAWSLAFFGLQSTTLGLVVIVALWLAILATIWAFDRVDRRAAALLVPYLLWVTFTAYLNYRFWMLN